MDTGLTQDEVVMLRQIQDGNLHFIDKHKAERLFKVGLASIEPDSHVSLTDQGKRYLRSLIRIAE
ncbi:hypothetical protein [Roseovarius sp.]|uniref:hypothetical protein n=1 Tax=Roseovarius sp. TaxID=1486281 RepID=UPI003BA9552A